MRGRDDERRRTVSTSLREGTLEVVDALAGRECATRSQVLRALIAAGLASLARSGRAPTGADAAMAEAAAGEAGR